MDSLRRSTLEQTFAEVFIRHSVLEATRYYVGAPNSYG